MNILFNIALFLVTGILRQAIEVMAVFKSSEGNPTGGLENIPLLKY